MTKVLGSDLTDHLTDLDAGARELVRIVDRLRVAEEVPRAVIDGTLEHVITTGRRLRDAIIAAGRQLDPPEDLPSWTDVSSLRAVVETLANKLTVLEAEARRSRLTALKLELEDGVIRESVAARRRRLEAQRRAATESVAAASPDVAAHLPWPLDTVPSWVSWVLSLEDPEATLVLEAIAGLLPALGDLIGMLSPGKWEYPTTEPEPHLGREPTSVAPVASQGPTEASDEATRSDATETEIDESLRAAEHDPIGRSPKCGDVRPETDLPLDARDECGVVGPTAAPVMTSAVHSPGGAEEIRWEGAGTAPRDDSGEPCAQGAPSASADDPAPARERTLDLVVTTRAFPEYFATYADFARSHWRDGNGVVISAPWLQPSFADQLEHVARAALAQNRLAHLVLFARCGEALDLTSIPRPADVRVLLELLANKDIAPVDENTTRVDDLSAANSENKKAGLASELSVVLAACLASPERVVPDVDADSIIGAAGLDNSATGSFLSAAFQLGAIEANPIQILRNELRRAPTRSPEELQAAVDAAADVLRKTKKQLWSAAGGKVQRSHCRQAWDAFMLAANPLLEDALAGRTDDLKSIEGLLGLHARLADRGGVKYQDRSATNRAAKQIVDAARALVLARREHARQERRRPGRLIDAVLASYQALRADGSEVDRLWVPLIEALASAQAGAPHVALDEQDFYSHPGLLETVPIVTVENGRVSVDPWVIDDPTSAACHLLRPADSISANRNGDAEDLLAYLRQLGREDLLVHVTPVSRADTMRAQEALEHARTEYHAVLSAAEREAARLHQVAHPSALVIERALSDAREIEDAETTNHGLLTESLRQLAAFAREEVDKAIPLIREQFAGLTPPPTIEKREAFERAINQGRLDEARRLAVGETPVPTPGSERATPWRRVAMDSYPEPRRILLEGRGEPLELCKRWFDGLRSTADGDKLRRSFAEFVFGTRFGKIHENEKNRESWVQSAAVRDWLRRERLNPSFLPQITAFAKVSIIVAPVPPTDRSFVQKTAEAVVGGKLADGRATIVLAPRISSNVRDNLRDDLRRRSARGYAIVDDLDFVRLVNPGGQQPNLVVGLLEIMLEQQPKWGPLNPFEPSEGQHTKPEMFVGREDEVRKLATRPQYSRLFSGRKLGKSALLKHVRDTHDGIKLPSGNTLRVLYVPVVGIDGEAQVVEKIRACFAEQLDHSPPIQPGPPDETLKQLTSSFLQRRERDSVLLFLDEADMFVEAQISAYEERREKCLTWAMRTDIEARKDAMDLPRVRFVFAGYRATHRNEGAWANWGDVLRLEPLAADAATMLVSGPLARLGINADAEAAAVAYRCGYQPAVIVRFGQRLVEHLDATVTPSRRESVAITPQDVSAAYQGVDVRNEIRTIVWNNFQGNPFGRIVFAATLLEFARLAPGAPLEDAPARVLSRLRMVAPGFLEESTAEGAPEERVARELRDFVERALLRLVDPAMQSYQLRFPHQLPILLQDDQEASIRREVPALEAQSGGKAIEGLRTVRSVLPRVALENLAEAITMPGIDALVAVSHYGPLLVQGAASVADRLGFAAGEVVDALESADDTQRRSHENRLAALNTTPESAQRVLSARSKQEELDSSLLVGGLDLLRWAIRNRREGRHEIELATVARLTTTQLQWWFERVRAIEFSGPSPARTFTEETSGIPFLVGLLDTELETGVGFDGVMASEDQVRAVIESYHVALERKAASLLSGDPALTLSVREAELFVMIARASASGIAHDGDDLREILLSPRDWAPAIPGFERWKPLEAGDEVHLEVLFRCGLLPPSPRTPRPESLECLVPLDPDDAAIVLAVSIEKCLSA